MVVTSRAVLSLSSAVMASRRSTGLPWARLADSRRMRRSPPELRRVMLARATVAASQSMVNIEVPPLVPCSMNRVVKSSRCGNVPLLASRRRRLRGVKSGGAGMEGGGGVGWVSFSFALVRARSARGRGCHLLRQSEPAVAGCSRARRLRHVELEVRSAAWHEERRITRVDGLHGQVRKYQGDVVAVRLDHRFVERKAEFTRPSVGFG
jgi:hypothetical protein